MPWLYAMIWRRLPLRDRRGNVAMIFALSLVPLVLIVGLAVDYSFYIQAKAQFDLAADAASTHAVRIASDAYANPSYYVNGATSLTQVQAENLGQTAGQQWFLAQLGTYSSDYSLATNPPAVAMSYLASAGGGFQATTTYSGSVNTFIGHFITPSWPIGNSSTAQQSGNDFIQIYMLLDNSSSMQIAATYPDYQSMMELTACVPDSSLYDVSDLNYVIPYGAYQCGGGGGTYDGALACPLAAATSPLSSPPFWTQKMLPSAFTSQPGSGFSCTDLPKVNGLYPTAREPCAFACHWDPNHTSNPAQGQDYYGLARKNGVTLRFDLLKNATNQVLRAMKADSNTATKNLQVGIYTFNSTLNPIYPGPNQGVVGNDFDTAISAVGSPPNGSTPESGILPETFTGSIGNNHDDTNFDGALQSLLAQVTASGTGNSVASPVKYLFLITDGYEDWQGNLGGVDVNQCQAFKNLGWTIYVVYTPYYPLMHYWYYLNNMATVEGTGPGSLSYNLQQCSSDPVNDYIAASDQTTLTNALNSFLQSALASAERVAR